MQIQAGYNNNTNFGATKIDTVKLMKRVKNDSFTPIKAHFNELHFNDKDDRQLIYKLQDKWQSLTSYGGVICKDFLERINDYRYFAIEALDEGKKKITNLCEVEIKPGKKTGKYNCHVMFLQEIIVVPRVLIHKILITRIKGVIQINPFV